jgi:hypothetical protein
MQCASLANGKVGYCCLAGGSERAGKRTARVFHWAFGNPKRDFDMYVARRLGAEVAWLAP